MVHQMRLAACGNQECSNGTVALIREDEWLDGRHKDCPSCGCLMQTKPYSLDEWRNLAAAANQSEAKSV